ncbi:MAG: NYN domain-containing protein [bacterium]
MIQKNKGTDVNLATYLLMDGIVNNYEKAVVVSNDGDLKIAVEVVKNTLKHEVIVMNPDRNKTKSWALKKAATKYIYVYERTLAKCQFPTILTDAHGTITKPASW